MKKAKISGSSLIGLSENARKNQIMKTFRQAQALAIEEKEEIIKELKSEIRGYELRNKLDSSELEEALGKGQIEQTAEVTTWLLAYQVMKKLEELKNTTGAV